MVTNGKVHCNFVIKIPIGHVTRLFSKGPTVCVRCNTCSFFYSSFATVSSSMRMCFLPTSYVPLCAAYLCIVSSFISVLNKVAIFHSISIFYTKKQYFSLHKKPLTEHFLRAPQFNFPGKRTTVNISFIYKHFYLIIS